MGVSKACGSSMTISRVVSKANSAGESTVIWLMIAWTPKTSSMVVGSSTCLLLDPITVFAGYQRVIRSYWLSMVSADDQCIVLLVFINI